MTTQIKLDTNAMNALFPEGSEARVKLQTAVIANFTEKLFDKKLESIFKAKINDLQSNMNRAVTAKTGAGWGDKLSLMPEAKELIESYTEQMVSKKIREFDASEIASHIHAFNPGTRAVVEQAIAQAKTKLSEKIDQMIAQVLAEKLPSILGDSK